MSRTATPGPAPRAALAIAMLAMVGCARDAAPGGRPVRFATGTGSANASLLIALRQGYFEANGARVEERLMNRPAGSLPELARGDLDVVATAPSAALFNLIGRGESVRVVADRGHHRAGACARGAVLKRRGLDLERLPRPVRIAASTGYIEEFVVDRAMRLLGLDAEGWRTIDVPTAAEAAALHSGGVDLLLASEPNLTRFQEEGLGTIWREVAEIVPSLQSHVIVFGPRLLGPDRTLGARFLAGYLQAERQLAAGKTEENTKLMSEVLDLDPGLARRVCWAHVRGDLVVDFASLDQFQRWAAGRRLLDRVIEPREYWDGDFAAGAVRLRDDAEAGASPVR